jgi:hypothetical protein
MTKIPEHIIDWSEYEKDLPKNILKGYKNPDAYVLLNEDKHLHPLWIPLPTPPDLRTIDGFGLAASKQKFTPPTLPKKLLRLAESLTTIDELWDEIEANQLKFLPEIEFIREQWKRYNEGYWCFINGKPTFIDGWHYTYCTWWRFKDGNQPDYRDRNRKFYHAMKYAYTTRETVVTDENGKLEYTDPILKIPKMRETGFRTVMGIAYPKHRRDGASNECLLAMYMEVITHMGVVGGIISMTGNHAQEKLFDEIVVAGWNQMPFFFRPKSTSNQNPNKQILFNADRSRSNKVTNDGLGSKVSYSPTADSTLYDGGKNIWINVDEAGKTKDIDSYLRHRQLKPCISQGNGANIVGFLTYPSTVGEMEGAGGKNFFRICQESKFEKRDLSGQTMSGLLVLYMPAYEGLEGFIGEYGESIIDEPTPEQAAFIGKDYGAKAHLESKRQQLLANNDMDGYNEEVRLFPTSYMECFRTTDGDVGFNTKKVNERIEELAHIKPEVRRGNFKWTNDEKDTFVYWEDDPKGRFYLSKILDESQTNRNYSLYIDGRYHKFPQQTKFVASADPFKFEKTEHSRMSKGGGLVFWDYDEEIDRGKPLEYWRSYKFVCSYLDRPPKREDYCEDMLMMCIYFGAMMNPEIDVDAIWRHFEERGYGGYLWYEIDAATNIKRKTPGFNSRTNKKQRIFDLNRDYIELHAQRCDHEDILDQWKNITSIEEMTDYDLIPCTGGCLMAAKGVGITNQFKKKEEESNMNGGLSDMYPMNNYN